MLIRVFISLGEAKRPVQVRVTLGKVVQQRSGEQQAAVHGIGILRGGDLRIRATYIYCQEDGRHQETDWEKQVPIFMDFLWLQ